jgi:5'-deoxynucleotidase YfbR-like HD superfamily hydrolase
MTPINLEIYDKRHKALSHIWRRKGYEEAIWFRLNVSSHTKRVVIITREVCSILEKLWISVKRDYVIALAEVHDDDEIITDDLAVAIKDRFSEEEKNLHKKHKIEAIQELSNKYGDLFEDIWLYEQLLKEETKENSLEFSIMKYVDKLEALMEVCQELWAWNKDFLVLHNKTKDFEVNSFEYAFKYAKIYLQNVSRLTGISLEKFEEFDICNLKSLPDYREIVQKTPWFTDEKSFKDIQSDFLPYQRWKTLLLENLPEDERKKLWEKSPFPILK